jgi:hypothetical protein
VDAAPGNGVARRGRKRRKGSSGKPTIYHGPVRRLLGWTAGVVGVAALARTLARSRRRHETQQALPGPAVDDRAEALRRKLDETRAAGEPRTDAPSDTTTTATADERSETLEERRARVHAKAQEAIEAMREPLG